MWPGAARCRPGAASACSSRRSIPRTPTRYRVDGVFEPMGGRSLAIEARRPDGSVETVRRTLYRTRLLQ